MSHGNSIHLAYNSCTFCMIAPSLSYAIHYFIQICHFFLGFTKTNSINWKNKNFSSDSKSFYDVEKKTSTVVHCGTFDMLYGRSPLNLFSLQLSYHSQSHNLKFRSTFDVFRHQNRSANCFCWQSNRERIQGNALSYHYEIFPTFCLSRK